MDFPVVSCASIERDRWAVTDSSWRGVDDHTRSTCVGCGIVRKVRRARRHHDSATAWLAMHALLHLKTGLLRWDGETWHWSEADDPGTEVPLAQVGVEIDLQSRMALQIALADGNSSWIWVETRSLPSDWLALRRALFSPVKTRKRTAGMSEPAPMRMDVGALLRTLWPNSWRAGLKLSSLYLCTVTLAFFCLKYFGLRANGQYGLSLQIMTVIQGMSAVWIAVKWPVIGQLRARQDVEGVRQIFWTRLWLQNITFAVQVAAALALVPGLLAWMGTDKRLIPLEWCWVLAVNAFLELQFGSWATLISTENRLPSLWPTVVSSAITVGLVWILIGNGFSGFGALVLGPLVVGSLFNYWFWGCYGARTLNTAWWRFTFRGPHSVAPSGIS